MKDIALSQSEQAERFKNPLVCRNIETGEGYSRLNEIWKYEGVEVIG